MKKNQFTNTQIIKIITIFISIIAVFMFFLSFVNFDAENKGQTYNFALDGLSLLVGSKASYVTWYDVILSDETYPNSVYAIIMFSFTIISIFIQVLPRFWIKKEICNYVIDGSFTSLFAINIILSFLLIPNLNLKEQNVSMGIGLILFIIIMFLLIGLVVTKYIIKYKTKEGTNN